MGSCDAELCRYWTGQGCVCEVFDFERPEPGPGQEDWLCPDHGHVVPWYEDECLKCLDLYGIG